MHHLLLILLIGSKGIRISSKTVKAGEVKFGVTNASTTMVHEMVVSPVKDLKKTPPAIWVKWPSWNRARRVN